MTDTIQTESARAAAVASQRTQQVLAVLGALWLAVGVTLFVVAPEGREGGISFTAPMIQNGWMAWTLATALFFWVIAGVLLLFTFLAVRFPETPRRGVLRIDTTRGDRLFITLLGSAFINLAWLGLTDLSQWMALIVCALYAALVFRFV